MITDPKDLNGLPSGTYEVGGEAAEEVHRQYMAMIMEDGTVRLPKHQPFHPPTCRCACGCLRKSRTGLLFCSHCRAGAHQLELDTQQWVEHRNAETENRARTHCTRCGQPHPWAELQPGTGLCNSCSS